MANGAPKTLNFRDQLEASLATYVSESPRNIAKFRSQGSAAQRRRTQLFVDLLRSAYNEDFSPVRTRVDGQYTPWSIGFKDEKADEWNLFAFYALGLLADAARFCEERSLDSSVAVGLVCDRIARYLEAADAEKLQCYTVNAIPHRVVGMFDHWELSADTVQDDPGIPLPITDRSFYTPLNDVTMGVLRRPCSVIPVESVLDNSGDALVWPILCLNLVVDFPVQAGFLYFIKAGQHLLDESVTGMSGRVARAAGHRWGRPTLTSDWHRRRGRMDAAATDRLEAISLAYGSAIARLDGKRKEQLSRAADQFLTVTYRGNWVARRSPASEAEQADDIFRLIAAIEGLMTGEERDHSELTRKVAQRAAMLLGRDPQDRIAVHNALRNAYAARSAYVHGSKPKVADVSAVRDLARRALLLWPAVACEYERGKLPVVLDEALMSNESLDANVLQFTRTLSI